MDEGLVRAPQDRSRDGLIAHRNALEASDAETRYAWINRLFERDPSVLAAVAARHGMGSQVDEEAALRDVQHLLSPLVGMMRMNDEELWRVERLSLALQVARRAEARKPLYDDADLAQVPAGAVLRDGAGRIWLAGASGALRCLTEDGAPSVEFPARLLD